MKYHKYSFTVKVNDAPQKIEMKNFLILWGKLFLN